MSATKLYTTQQAAQMIGYSDARLRYLIRFGRAKPKQQIGRTWVFSAKEVDRLRSRSKASRA